MRTFEYIIKDELGLHARPAGLLVKCASSCESDITIELNGNAANAKRLFAVMGLNVKKGDTVKFNVTGSSEDVDIVRLKDFCEQNI